MFLSAYIYLLHIIKENLVDETEKSFTTVDAFINIQN